MKLTAAILTIVAVLPAATAFGQGRRAAAPPPAPKAFVSIGGAYQVSSHDFDETSTLRVNAEDGQLRRAYKVPAGVALDVAGGATIVGRLGVAVGVSSYSKSADADVSASIPHPFFFNRPRAVSGTANGLTRTERAVHVQARYTLPLNGAWVVMVFGGPSFFAVSQQFVTSLAYSETYPFDSAEFRSATIEKASGNKAGFNAGTDVGYFFTRHLGAGATVRYAGTTIDLHPAGGATTSVKAGGLQAGGGLRIRF
jgi:hypothetical protein